MRGWIFNTLIKGHYYICAQTPFGALVDGEGCPTDEDSDAVFDGFDQCTGTPIGATVDQAGCPSDSDTDSVLDGLDAFFEHHRFLDIARGKPIPHEAYYQNSGYFYFFGHFYAAGVLELLNPAEQVRYRSRLARERCQFRPSVQSFCTPPSTSPSSRSVCANRTATSHAPWPPEMEAGPRTG